MPVGRHRVYTGVQVNADFELDRHNMARLAVSEKMKALVEGIAEDVALPYAKSISEQFRETGDYEGSFKVEHGEAILPAAWPMRRVTGILLNESDHAFYVEVGRNGQNAHHIFRKTLEYLTAQSGGSVIRSLLARPGLRG